jgi:preprotein translocase subunit SecF
MHFIKPDINLDFMGKKYIAYTLSAVLVIMGMAMLIYRGGPNKSVDFTGGWMIQIKLATPPAPQDASKIRELVLKPLALQDEGIPQVGNKAEYAIRIKESKDISKDTLQADIDKALKAGFGEGAEVQSLDYVGASVGKDLTTQALSIVFYTILLIAIYISGRFEKKWTMSIVMAVCLVIAILLGTSFGAGITWLIVIALIIAIVFCWILRLKYAMGAILSLVHDVAIVMGAFALTNREVSLTVVAAILTLIGYSLNDTIIVYDRIRENLRNAPARRDMVEIMNRSVNQTLSRTILTSGTVFVTVAALYFFGGSVIHDFAFALVVGVITGTYSSIYIASPLLLLWDDGPVKKGKKIQNNA